MMLLRPHNLILKHFKLDIAPEIQPDDISCGLSCLKMVLDYYDQEQDMQALSEICPPLYDIGLFDSQLGKTAIDLGFDVTIYTYNYRIFHPIWNRLHLSDLIGKLVIKQACAMTPHQALSARHYIEYLQKGGELLFYPLSKELILAHLDQEIPVIAALDMSFLYDCVAFYDEFSEYRATHFVIIHGYDPKRNVFHVCDPWHSIPIPHENGRYAVDADRVINAIFLGQDRNDSSLIVIRKK
ncbi:hypothetical protein JW926_04265 [Candidatus Sumerlaeota bacterium]|nr:hypothetical protein [Candidatus Sumerlaeota bacterium]